MYKNDHNREVEYRAARTYYNASMWKMWDNQMIIPEFRAHFAHQWACVRTVFRQIYYWIGTADIQREREKYQHPRNT